VTLNPGFAQGPQAWCAAPDHRAVTGLDLLQRHIVFLPGAAFGEDVDQQRLKAIEGLGSYVKNDVRVRDAVLEALVNDSNPGLRTQALHLLEPVRADSSVRVVLQKLAENDQNLYIRTQARNVLSQMSEID